MFPHLKEELSMRRVTFMSLLAIFIIIVLSASSYGVRAADDGASDVKTLRDILWVWGNPEMGTEGPHTVASYAQASPKERAALLGARNIILAGTGVPLDYNKAEQITEAAASAKRLIWEILPDDFVKDYPPTSAFDFSGRMEVIFKLADKYPQLEAVLIDDMSTVAVERGLKPQHMHTIREKLRAKNSRLEIWGAVYAMNLNDAHLPELMKDLDVILLCEWHGNKLKDLEASVRLAKQKFPDKRIVLGTYMYDYGPGRRMPVELLDHQYAVALKLAEEGLIEGIEFTSIDNDAEAVQRTTDWIAGVTDHRIGSSGSTQLKIGDGNQWRFSGAAWKESDGVIQPPDERHLHSRAFHLGQSYGDFTVEFEYNPNYREQGFGGAGLILRAQDSNHFYSVYFPWGSQALRAKNFWASIVKVDGNGYLRSLKSEWVPGVPSETDRWYKVRVLAHGPQIEVWVDGRRAVSARDDSFRGGAVGLMGYGWYSFRNVKITGQQAPLAPWPDKIDVPTHSFTVGLNSKSSQSACIAPNGDVLLAAGSQLVRSKDRGRTWSAPETLPDFLGGIGDLASCMFRAKDGRLLVQGFRGHETREGNNPPQILLSESTDNGTTWSTQVIANVESGWPERPNKLYPCGAVVQTDDSTMIRFMLGSLLKEGEAGSVVTWGELARIKAFAIRSTDAGKNWSKPIEIDQPAWSGQPRGSIPGSQDLTEVTGAAIGNQIIALVRPVYSPYMWQCSSTDAGASWDSAARTTFPGYGGPCMIRTQNGTLVCGKRMPHYSLNLSSDGGLNWDDSTIIDYPVWAMGSMVEVEPNVVLCTYMNWDQTEPLLAQLVRVHPDHVEPIK
jgi:hypothetical protein